MIEIRQLNKKSLRDFIYSEEYCNLEYIPITRHRALSHIENPRAGEDDTLLLLAYADEQLVGYLGVLPDAIYHKDSVEACGWLSCLWVDIRFRGRQIAFQLLQRCIDCWQGRLLVTEFTGPAKRLYDKSGIFNDLPTKGGIRLYVRSDLEKLLPPKRRFFANNKRVLRWIDGAINGLFDLRFHFYSGRLGQLQLEYVNVIDDEIDQFLKERQEREIFKRRAEELNWIIKNPWVLPAPDGDRYAKKYHFSAVDKSFDFVPVKVYGSGGNLIAFLIFAKRDRRLKLPYCYHDGDVRSVVEVINYHIVRWRIKTFTTFNLPLIDAIEERRSPALIRRQVKRNYIIGSILNFEESEGDFEIQDGDADCSFT